MSIRYKTMMKCNVVRPNAKTGLIFQTAIVVWDKTWLYTNCEKWAEMITVIKILPAILYKCLMQLLAHNVLIAIVDQVLPQRQHGKHSFDTIF